MPPAPEEKSPEIELIPVPVQGGAQFGPGFLPADEPAKVPLTPAGENYSTEQVEGMRDMEKECLYMENAALKEALMQKQNWLWASQTEWCQGQDAWMAQRAELQPGAEVVFQGLKSQISLNGQHAVIERWDQATERWVVRLQSGEDKFVKQENLTLAYPWGSMYGNFMPPYAWPAYDARETGAQRGGRGRKFGSNGSNGLAKKAPSPATSFGSSTTGGGSFVSDATTERVNGSFSSCDGWDLEGPSCGIPDSEKTTVMMRNIPNDYTRTMLLKLLDTQGFGGKYDLVYLPIDYHSKVGFGYAFINLISPAEAERFRKHFTDFSKWNVVSQKVCEVCWSSVLQGVQAHIDRYRNSPVMHEAVRDEFKPVLFENGVRISFPKPTKSIRAPRARRRDAK